MQDARAFIQRIEIEPTAPGPLSGLTFAAKDIYDVAGTRTGCGNPDWARTHAPATAHAEPVAALLAAGARLVGKTHTDELAFSLMGENAHYGAPLNTADPRRVPGGSSSGSAAAVAAGLVDIALGSDTGGSVRGPASFCGIWGIRPSHGAIGLGGTMPLAPSYDTVGWFARDPETLARAGAALGLGLGPAGTRPARLLLPVDAWAVPDALTAAALAPALARLEARLGTAEQITLAPEGLDVWRDCFRICMGAESWATHGPWIRETRPTLGPGTRERFEACARLTAAEIAAAEQGRRGIVARLHQVIGPGDVVVLPTVPGPAPLLGAPEPDSVAWRNRAHLLLCPAGHAGLPQISLPAGTVDGGPVGLSLLGPAGSDGALLALATEVWGEPARAAPSG